MVHKQSACQPQADIAVMAYPLIMSRRKLARVFTDMELSDLLLRACHDLRAPVRAIRAHAELFLRDAVSTADFRERLGFMVDGARKIDLLVDALSSYSLALRIEAASFQPTPVDVVLRTVLARLDGEMRANGAQVTHTELPRVLGNPDRLIDLLERLLCNSLQHRGPASPRIHITAAAQARGWLFAIRDNGPGLDAACLESIFKPFEHVPGGQRTGAGMGLAICKVIVERHGGTIWAESKAGEGATFLFTLPADS